ncbi:MAG: NADH-quinone oxidoreductase subunit C [Gaiellales bacterium]|nr:MAG: NADH-quinone oxidoreductase subunit C [Gaiellales bacterium]
MAVAREELTAEAALERVEELAGEHIESIAIEEGGRLLIRLAGKELPIVCRAIRDDAELSFKYLVYVTATDFEDRIEAVYFLRSINHQLTADLRVDLDRERPTLPSVSSIWRTACWHERETYDFFGIIYTGHPELNRILTGVKGGVHPLRKDEQPHRVRRQEWKWDKASPPLRLPGEPDRKTRS